MASRFNRFINKTTLSSLKSSIKSSSSRSTTSLPRTTSSPVTRSNFSRIRSELGGIESLLPLHSAVASARMTSCLSTKSRSCRALSQDKIDDT